jgi:hypothetical protein
MSVLPLLATLLQGGLNTASGYYQGKAGNYNPTASQLQAERTQQLAVQHNQLSNQLKMQQAQYDQEKAMADLNTSYQRDRIIAGDNQAKLQQIDKEYADKFANQKKMFELAMSRLGTFGGVQGNNTPGSALSKTAPTSQEQGAQTMQNLGAVNSYLNTIRE